MTGVTMILSESGKRDNIFLGVTEKYMCLFYYLHLVIIAMLLFAVSIYSYGIDDVFSNLCERM